MSSALGWVVMVASGSLLVGGFRQYIDTCQYRRMSILFDRIDTMASTPSSDSRLLQAVADPLRLRILRQLAQVGPVCACDIAAGYSVSQPTISHHLRVLREAGW